MGKLATALILSSMLVFGEHLQASTGAVPLNAGHTAPSVPAPLSNQPAMVPKKQDSRRILCDLKIAIKGRMSTDIKIRISSPNTTLELGSSNRIKSCEDIQTSCPALVVAVPTSEGGLCCQNGKNQLRFCTGLEFIPKGQSGWRLWLTS